MASLSESQQLAVEVIAAMARNLQDGQCIQNVGFIGRSMLPMLRQRKDSVELTKAPEKLQKYDLPLYMGQKGKYVMHRIVDVKDDYYVCLGDNTYSHERIKPEQILAVVSAFYRGKRRISVSSPAYRLYCRIWCAIFPVRKPVYLAYRWLRRLVKGK